jgi:hypothetical protein
LLTVTHRFRVISRPKVLIHSLPLFTTYSICFLLGAAFYSSDSGVTWLTSTIPTTCNVALVRCADYATGCYITLAGYNNNYGSGLGSVYTSSDFGATFTENTPVTGHWNQLACDATNTRSMATNYDGVGAGLYKFYRLLLLS